MTVADSLRRVDDQRAADLGERMTRLEERVGGLITRIDSDLLRRVGASEAHHEVQDTRIDALEKWHDETTGALNLMRVLIGTSIASLILSGILIWLQVHP